MLSACDGLTLSLLAKEATPLATCCFSPPVRLIRVVIFRESLQSNKQVKIALLSLCGSLLGFIITFLTGAVQSDKADDEPPALREPNVIPPTDEHVEPERISCTTVAFLLHFTLLATFMWISLYGHLMMEETFDNDPPEYWTYLSLALGWGLPAVVGGDHNGHHLYDGRSSGIQTRGILLARSSGQEQTL
ncbi:unnamed protein product [Pleuronectes platessa]|uniref:Uncharacterized protein n=1 Tax=Pleuronectes platessa TaxID=8262 RepID=A0A9N7UBL2_PLEPL|nr:unnamed protein product [Pleuronectes platessa]